MVIREAMEWLDTPFHHGARIKHAGVDCINLLAAAFARFETVSVPTYPKHWYVHQREERLLEAIMPLAVEITQEEAEPADVVVYKFGHCFSHAAIIIKWPKIIHAFLQYERVVTDEGDQGIFSMRQRRFLRRKAWAG